MEIVVREINENVVILDIDGDIDIYNTSDLKNAINEKIDAGKKYVITNLARVAYIDSSGIGALIASLTKLRRSGGSLKILHAYDAVKKVFELTKMTSFFDIFDEEEEALKSCQ